MSTAKALYSEYSRLVDEKHLGQMSRENAAKLAHIEGKLETLEAPKASRMKRTMDRELAALKNQMAAVQAKMSDSAIGRSKAKTATSD